MTRDTSEGRTKTLIALASIGILVALSVGLSGVSTFDFQESLARQIASEMKRSGDYFNTTWDGRAFSMGTPTYFWWIVLASHLFDGATPVVSSFTMKVVSSIAVFGTFICSGYYLRLLKRSNGFFFSALIPASFLFLLLSLRAVGPDVLYAVFLVPLLCSLHIKLARAPETVTPREKEEPQHSTILFFSLFLAMILKGVAPFFLVSATLLFASALWPEARASIKTVIKPILSAALLALVFFAWLNTKTDGRYLNHVLRYDIQKLGAEWRSDDPFGHASLLLFFTGISVPFAYYVKRTDFSKTRKGIPVLWTFFYLLFYGNSSGGIWQFIPLSAPFILIFFDSAEEKKFSSAAGEFVRAFVVSLLFATGVLSCGALLLTPFFLSEMLFAFPFPLQLFLRPVAQSHNALLAIGGLGVCSLLAWGGFFSFRSFRTFVPALALINSVMVVLVFSIILPIIQTEIGGPISFLIKRADFYVTPTERLGTVGMHSPNASLAAGTRPLLQVPAGDPEIDSLSAFLVPEWYGDVCENGRFRVVEKKGFYLLCTKE